MESTSGAQFWTARRVLWYSVIVGLVLFVVYKQSLVQYVLEKTAHVVGTLVVAVGIAYLLGPVVSYLCRVPWPRSYRSRRTLAALIVLLGFLALLGFLGSLVAAPIVQQSEDLGQLVKDWTTNLPAYLDQLRQSYHAYVPPALWPQIQEQAANLAGKLLSANYFGVAKWLVLRGWYLVEALIIPVLVFHLLRDGRALREGLLAYVPQRHRQNARLIIGDLHLVLKSYVRGILVLALLFGLVTTALLSVAHNRAFLTLGLLAGVSWTIPIIGPAVMAVPLVAVTWAQAGFDWAVIVLLVYIGLNVAWSKLVFPFVLGEAMRLHPITVIVSLLLVGQLLGPLGMLMAVPLAAMVRIVYLRYQKIQASAGGST
jgi:predicted PurR-regulated permease PerM